MKREELDDLARLVRESLTTCFEQTGQLPPGGVAVLTADPETSKPLPKARIIQLLPGEASTEAWVVAIRNLCKRGHALACCYFSEAWAAQFTDPSEHEKYESLEDAPGRRELVLFTYQRNGAATETWIAEIIREEGKRPRLGEFEQSQGKTHGRLAALMPEVN